MTDIIPEFSSVHFVGIGGAGMSGIARVLHERGVRVTGSDLKESSYVRDLEEVGIVAYIGHRAATIDEARPDVVVTSSAVPETNPEVIRARELNLPVWPRAKMLSVLSRGQRTIAVAGTHGKTTTSSMVATMLDHLGQDPSFLIGGVVEEYGTNGRNGEGPYFVCEADESDGSFLFLDPDVVIVTNVEADHLDHYGTLENVERAFCQFMDLVGKDGCVVVNGDDPHLVELARSVGRRFVSYGFDASCDYVCTAKSSPHSLVSTLCVRTPEHGEVEVTIKANPGRHNMANATAAIASADVCGLDVAAAARALSAFQGAHRRFTHVGDIDGITVVDDYGHHPTEIRATLGAAKALGYRRVVCVFQPHRYSRTQALADEFAHAFDDADVLVVCEVFSAGETPIPGVSGKVLAGNIRAAGGVGEVRFEPTAKKVVSRLVSLCREGDLVITQGAGDVTAIGPAFIEAMGERDEAGLS
ncbi:UDP-N-acetylmuramate--L-alanine ligase [Olsenella sp. HMSC062G07]|uniref:UDP-N-acetylmuramate--L-alanine ligase n=1 Tax=Olsenella sp. HMSC062G07 TaxID=1739330 RepID=UPI000A3E91CF|nr:UDP-N-acetylmuramate--L-alanine ligase [Olsenella sp. HMSC062G07]